jgi:hypothetical protein
MKFTDVFYHARVSALLALLVAASMFAGRPAYAEQASLEQVLEGKQVVATGECPLAGRDKLAFDSQEVTTVASCVVGRTPGDVAYSFVGLLDSKGYFLVIRVDNNTKEQLVMWRRGAQQI